MGRIEPDTFDNSKTARILKSVPTSRWISPIVVFVALLAIVAAAWVAAGALKEPAPVLPSAELDSLRAEVAKETDAVLSSRSDALDSLAETRVPIAGGVSGPARLEGVSSFESARNRAVSAMSDGREISVTLESGGLIPLSPTIDRAMNIANTLFGEAVTENTAHADTLWREAFENEGDDYISYLGFRTLDRVLGRDLISYSTLDSLALQEAKITLYRDEWMALRDSLELSRDSARARRDSGSSVLEHHYRTLLAVLIHRVSRDIENGEAKMLGPEDESGLMDEIAARLAGFAPVRLPGDRGMEPVPMPFSDQQAWLSLESERTREFGELAAEMESD